MTKDKLMWLGAGLLIGIVAGNKLHALPVLNKIPQAS